MELREFEETLKNNNALKYKDYLIFNDFEIYDLEKDTSVNFENLEELYEHEIEGKKLKDIILGIEKFYITLEGGRGSGSSSKGMAGGFTSARQGGRKSKEYGATQFPARLNTEGQRYKSYEKTLKKFEKMYKDADIEYGATIDDQGFAHKLIKGGSTSVPIHGQKGQMILHNHPSGGNFSKADLIVLASGSEKGIVAVGSNVKKDRMRYTITKNKNFKAKEFAKAVNRAQWPKNLSYDKGADWWLRKNAKTYGYKYSAQKIK